MDTKINKEWPLKNRMPINPTFEQRVSASSAGCPEMAKEPKYNLLYFTYFLLHLPEYLPVKYCSSIII
jgi:hypothetical protein